MTYHAQPKPVADQSATPRVRVMSDMTRGPCSKCGRRDVKFAKRSDSDRPHSWCIECKNAWGRYAYRMRTAEAVQRTPPRMPHELETT